MSSVFVDKGWYATKCDDLRSIESFILDIARDLGECVSGRHGQIIENLNPLTHDQSYPNSLSEKYGLGPLPLHSDTAHWIVPCRYIILACLSTGGENAPSILLDTKKLSLSDEVEAAVQNAPFYVRNGRKSFYSSIRAKESPFFRFDPGFMEPMTAEAKLAVRSLGADANEEILTKVNWEVGMTIIIDNWRLLHGRGQVTPKGTSRHLLRVSIK